MIKQEEDKLKDFLRSKNLRLTPERKAILKAAFSMHEHFDVEKLYRNLRKEKKSISRATIYRAIPFLVESGLVKEVMRCLNKTQYEHVFGHKHHDHLVCIKCGRIIEFTNEKIEKLQDEVCKRYGFRPVEHRLGIRGFCQQCKGEIDADRFNPA